MEERLTTGALLSLEHSAAGALLGKFLYPWQALSEIRSFILSLGAALDGALYRRVGEDVWIARDAKIHPSANVGGPTIIDCGASLRPGAFLRGAVIVGKGAVIGNSTELKNCVLFDGVEAPHFNYLGDSILGWRAHLGAGAITSNIRSDKKNVVVRGPGGDIETGLRKFGAIVGDGAEIGCNAVLNPGAILGKGVIVYPTSCVRGFVPAGHILKCDGTRKKREG